MAPQSSLQLLVLAIVFAGCAGASGVPSGAANQAESSPPGPTAAPSATALASTAPATEPAPSAPTSANPSPSAAPPAAPAAEAPPPGSPGERLMRDHFQQTITIRESIIWAG
jgi:hypothetical protein